MSKIFIDTNILVYTQDVAAAAKHDRAKALWNEFINSGDEPILSTQILQEYYNALTRKLHVAPAAARTKVTYLWNVDTVLVTPAIIDHAMELNASDSVSFWDALVISAAQSARCDQLWTEDMQEGRKFGQMEVVNPFIRR